MVLWLNLSNEVLDKLHIYGGGGGGGVKILICSESLEICFGFEYLTNFEI